MTKELNLPRSQLRSANDIEMKEPMAKMEKLRSCQSGKMDPGKDFRNPINKWCKVGGST